MFMYRKIILSLLYVCSASLLLAQSKFTVSGTVANKANNETLIGATIIIPETNTSVITNSYGFYSITLPKGDYTIIISYTGFDNVEEKISLTQDTKRNFVMNEKDKALEEVVIKSNRGKVNIGKPEMSTNKLSIATIKKMPAMMGEVDILKSILQLPGVTNAQDPSHCKWPGENEAYYELKVVE